MYLSSATTTSTTIKTTTPTTTTATTTTTGPPFVFYSCYSNNTNCGDLEGYALSTSYTGISRCQSYCSNYIYFGIQTCSGYFFQKIICLKKMSIMIVFNLFSILIIKIKRCTYLLL